MWTTTSSLIAVVIAASLFPVHGQAAVAFDGLTNAAIALLFFMHGAKLTESPTTITPTRLTPEPIEQARAAVVVADAEALEFDAVRVRDERAAVACAPSARARLLSNVIAMVAAFGGRGPVPAGSRQQDVAVVRGERRPVLEKRRAEPVHDLSDFIRTLSADHSHA